MDITARRLEYHNNKEIKCLPTKKQLKTFRINSNTRVNECQKSGGNKSDGVSSGGVSPNYGVSPVRQTLQTCYS